MYFSIKLSFLVKEREAWRLLRSELPVLDRVQGSSLAQGFHFQKEDCCFPYRGKAMAQRG